MFGYAGAGDDSSSSDEDERSLPPVRFQHVPIDGYSASPMRFAANLCLAVDEATAFAEDFLDNLSHAHGQPEDANLNVAGSMRIELAKVYPHGMRFGRHNEARFASDAALRAACRDGTDWAERGKLPHVLWWEESTGYPCIDFGAFCDSWVQTVPVLIKLFLVRALHAPDPEQAKDSFRHKANAWGFVFTRLSEGVYRMQLSRSDHPPCDFRRGLVGLGNVPFKRCASRDKVKLPTTKARKRKRS